MPPSHHVPAFTTPATAPPDLPLIWEDFRRELAACDARLLGELRAAVAAVESLVARQALVAAVGAAAPAPSLASLATLCREHRRALVDEPFEVYRRQGPLPRALDAFDAHGRAVEHLIRALPETLSYPGAEWVTLLGPSRVGPVLRLRLALRRSVVVAPGPALLLGARAYRAARGGADGRLLVALGEASLDLLTPWRIVRRTWFSAMTAQTGAARRRPDLMRAQARTASHARRLSEALAAVETWPARFPSFLARHLLASGPGATARLIRLTTSGDQHREFLGRQSRAVDADIELHARLAVTDAGLVEAAEDAYASLERERAALVGEIDGVVAWLDGWRPGDVSPFPPAAAEIVPSATRLRAFAQTAHGIVGFVPETVEVAARLATRPGVRDSWTVQAPRAIVGDSLSAGALARIGEGLTVVERQHQGLVLEIERAREVVAFARETTGEDTDADGRIEAEGVANARGLVQFHRQQLRGISPEVDAAFVTGLAGAFDRTYRLLEEGQLGLLREAARDGLPRAAGAVWRRSMARVRRGATALVRWSGGAYRSALVAIGWIPAPAVAGAHVVTRDYLTRSLGAEAKLEQLPMIYRRLFRLAPVEDPRFLIGRHEEMAGIADARRLWEEGRAAGILLIGARGSGKTSLLNCATQRVLGGLDLVRSEFVERLTSQDEMHAFLARLFDADPADLERTLTDTRRVVVLEECERTFLRTPHGYEAIRTLLGLISRTSTRTLWILSVNHSCFRLLNAALRLEPHFSHQINAMAVERAHLREAIMMRHALSGLRLRFAPPVAQDGWARRILRASGMPLDGDTEFFDALYRESGGVFRTAFALWQRYIDRAEGGVLYMQYPHKPAYERIVASLDVLDLFTLAALLQHGSLTPQEHSRVFQIDDSRSRAWLDNLLARELIEPDPGRYGFRVIPDAAPIVRQTLFRRNLA